MGNALASTPGGFVELVSTRLPLAPEVPLTGIAAVFERIDVEEAIVPLVETGALIKEL